MSGSGSRGGVVRREEDARVALPRRHGDTGAVEDRAAALRDVVEVEDTRRHALAALVRPLRAPRRRCVAVQRELLALLGSAEDGRLEVRGRRLHQVGYFTRQFPAERRIELRGAARASSRGRGVGEFQGEVRQRGGDGRRAN